MKTPILTLILLALETSLLAIPVTLTFSGTVTEADQVASANGFGAGTLFSGALVYDPALWDAGTPMGNRGNPRLFIYDSIYQTSGMLNQPLFFGDGSDRDVLSFVGEIDLMNFLSLSLVDWSCRALNGPSAPDSLYLADWSSGEIIAGGSSQFSFGSWRGSILMPSIRVASAPDGGATASMLAVAMVGLLMVSVQGKSRPG